IGTSSTLLPRRIVESSDPLIQYPLPPTNPTLLPRDIFDDWLVTSSSDRVLQPPKAAAHGLSMPLEASIVPDVVSPTWETWMNEFAVGRDIMEGETGPLELARRLESFVGDFDLNEKLRLRLFVGTGPENGTNEFFSGAGLYPE